MNSKKFYDSASNYHVSLHSVTTLTGDREIKLPDSSATLVGDTSTQTLTNKTFTDLTSIQQTTLGTTPVATVTIAEYGDGRDVTTVLTLTNFIVGALAGAAADLGVGNIVYAFPAGAHLEIGTYQSISLKRAGTAVAADLGLGSVIATGVVSVLSGTATFENRGTGLATTTASGGGTVVAGVWLGTTSNAMNGICQNIAASVKNVFLNAAGTWNADNTGNLTATGTITLKWTKLSA